MIRYPNISGNSDSQKLEQVKAYLHQLADELNYQLTNTTAAKANSSVTIEAQRKQQQSQTSPNVNAFNEIKALIIKSADIVNAYYDEIAELIKQSNLYVAQSDFGKFVDETKHTLYSDAEGLTQQVQNIQQIFNPDGTIMDERICSGYIKSGILDNDSSGPIIGLEIGQRNEDGNGDRTFDKYARFTANKISFFDSNGMEVAYISDRKLYIPDAQITNRKAMGHFIDIVNTNGSITTKYVPMEASAND